MKLLHTALSIPLTIVSIILSRPAVAEQTASPAADPHSQSAAAPLKDSPAQQRIAAAQLQIKANPEKLQAYNELAIGFLRRARETAEPNYLNEADDALAQGLKLDGDDFQLHKTQIALLLSRHQFVQARDQAKILNHNTPDDVMIYGYIAEADIELGDYAEAEKNAQWMMDLRPNNTPALLLGARLRVLFGEPQGAIEFLNRAYSQTSPVEVEDQAWIANKIASIQIDLGETNAAEQTLRQAEQLFPNYPYAMENMALLRLEQNRAEDAVEQWKEAARIDHDPSLLFQMARAQELAGHPADAQATYAEFARRASQPGTATDASRLDLILKNAASPATAPEALRLAEQEIKLRHDVWTLDAYAWSLYANARFQEADAAEQKVIAVGIQNAQAFDHAGHIAQKLNRGEDSARYFKLVVQSNPASEFAADALKFARLGVTKADRAPNTVQSAPPPDPTPSVDPHATQAATPNADRNALPAQAAMINGAAAFAPVPAALLTPEPTDTSRLILTAQSSLARNPRDAQNFAGLGAAYFQHARETGDVSDFQLAEEALAKSLDIDSSDFSADAALETMAAVCMGEHRFADALSFAQKALSLGTGDVSPFAIVGDAYADMGDYDKAAAAYGRLTPRDMTLSPRASYGRDSRLAYLKFMTGDTAGAIQLMKTAVAEGVEAQLPRENLAWLYYELGEFDTQAGEAASADAAYLAALNTHPGDYRALAALGKLRANNGRYQEAIVLYQGAIAVVPMPAFIAELGDLYQRQGNPQEAQKQFALVEYIGLLGHINQVLHNRDLALFYADHDIKLAEALELAQKELEVRHDIYTWDALAWALYKNGKLAEAASASEKATKFGTRDSLLLFHAGMIAKALGKQQQAQTELKTALQINPHFHLIYATTARQQLDSINAQAELQEGSNEHAR